MDDNILLLNDKNGKPYMWLNKKEWDTQNKWVKKQELKLINKWYNSDISTFRNSLKRDLKFCYIYAGNTKKLAMIDKKTNKVYKLQGYDVTWMEHKNYKFDRYCRSMDL